jgi:predicted nucleic acid-binding protein
MRTLLDTNILLRSSQPSSAHHASAIAAVTALLAANRSLCISSQVIYLSNYSARQSNYSLHYYEDRMENVSALIQLSRFNMVHCLVSDCPDSAR